MRWSAVFAGTVLAVGLWILLQVLGMGLGLSAVDTDDAGSLKGVGIGTGIWTLIAPLIAIFVGSMLVGRLSGSRDRKIGAMHGSVMWALSMAVGLWAMLSVVSALASGAAHVGGAAAQATSSIVKGAANAGASIDGNDAMKALGIDTNDLLGPINQKLQQEGKPQVTASQVNATIRAVAQRGLHDGRLDRQVLVEELARNTALSQADAQQIADQTGARYQELATKVSSTVEKVGEQAKSAGLQAADKTGKVLLLGGVMMLLSLGAAVGGGALGVRSRGRDDIDRRDLRDIEGRTTTTTVPPPTIITPPPEV